VARPQCSLNTVFTSKPGPMIMTSNRYSAGAPLLGKKRAPPPNRPGGEQEQHETHNHGARNPRHAMEDQTHERILAQVKAIKGIIEQAGDGEIDLRKGYEQRAMTASSRRSRWRRSWAGMESAGCGS